MSKNLVVKILMDAHDKASGALGRIKASASGLSKELTKTSEELKRESFSHWALLCPLPLLLVHVKNK